MAEVNKQKQSFRTLNAYNADGRKNVMQIFNT